MATNVVHEHGTNHIKIAVAVSAHTAGDLVCEKGFYGIVLDDVVAGDPFTLLLDPTVTLPYVASTLAAGVIVTAPATAQPTSLPIGAAAASVGLIAGGVTAGWVPFGKVIATGTATTAKIQLFNPSPFRAVMP